MTLCIISCNKEYDTYKEVIVVKTDTIIYRDTFDIFVYKSIIKHQKDTIDFLIRQKDSISSDLFIAKYKLNRIKYYNDVASKGNNIKYLRGWINRVIKE